MVAVGDILPPISWMQPGFEVPYYDPEGNVKGVIRISHVDVETNTIYLETETTE